MGAGLSLPDRLQVNIYRMCTTIISILALYDHEPQREKTDFLHMQKQKQRRRSASR